jgi:uncharacterized protein DUF5666
MSYALSIHACSKIAVGVLIIASLGAAACNGDSAPLTGPSGGSSQGSDRVKLEAVVTDRAGSCPTLRFRLGGIRVETNANTDFKLSCDRIVNDRSIEAQGARLSGDVLMAREVETDDDARLEPEFEAEGPIDSLSAGDDCSRPSGRSVIALGLRFAAGTFTRFRDISAGCVGLTAGMRIRAKGPLDNPFALQANEVERRQP